MSERPAWLDQEPELLALLNFVVDRFDQQSGDARRRAILIPVAQHVHSLTAADAAADQTWALIGELQRRGVLSIRQTRRSPYDPPWMDAKLAFAPEKETLLRLWLNRTPIESVMGAWRRAVMAYAHAFPGGCESLLERRIAIEGRDALEIVAALARIADVHEPATLRQLSAYAFWGDSKVLDDRAELIATLFPRLEIRDRPIVAAVHLPERIDGVLFIENQDTYTAAIAGQPSQSTNHALVYLAGFRGAAVRIRARTGACLHFHGVGAEMHAAAFERWWFSATTFDRPLMFWGDLDFSGMQILKALRARFGEVTAWRPGYEPMLADLRASDRVFDPAQQGQIDPDVTGCTFADVELLPAIRACGFWHQERIAASPPIRG